MARKRLMHLVSVSMPWPDTVLSPNTTAHWAVKAKAKKDYKRIAAMRTYQANQYGFNQIEGRVEVEFHFYPPRTGKYDEDNLIARMKSGIDGIAQAIKTDDSNFHYKEMHIHDPVSGGLVIANITFLTKRAKKLARMA